MKVKTGDKVLIIKGRDRGKSGKIARTMPSKLMVVIDGLNLHKKTIKAKHSGEKGRIVSVAWPMRVENIMLVCDTCGKPTRVGFRLADGSATGAKREQGDRSQRKKKVRYCKKCEAIV